MKQNMRKALGIALALVMAFTLLPAAFARDDEGPGVVGQGYCGGEGDGTNLTWLLDGEGVLTISGAGAMADYPNTGARPWAEYYDSVSDIVLEPGVTTVGDRAFAHLPNISEIVLPDGVAAIGEYAFAGLSSFDASGLTALTVPPSVTRFAGSALAFCPSLCQIRISDLDAWCAIEVYGDGMMYDMLYDLILNGTVIKDLVIPAGVTEVGRGTFRNASIQSVVFPEGLTSIGDGAFIRCAELTGIDLPDTLTHIGWEAFLGCAALTELTIPGSVASWGYDPYYTESFNMSEAFADCTALKKVTVNEGVETIPCGTFAFCGALEEIGLPDSLLRLGDSGIRNVTTPHFGVFEGCRSLAEITLPPRLQMIGFEAFVQTALQSVTIPGSVTDMGEYAFSSTGITSAKLEYGVTKTPLFMFVGSPLQELYLPAGIELIGNWLAYSSYTQIPEGRVLEIWYGGSEEDWSRVVIQNTYETCGNNYVLQANMHYGYHAPGGTVTEDQTDPTCAAPGGYDEIVLCAYCADEYSRTHVTVNALPHTPGKTVRENEVPATCTEAGGYDEVVYCVNCPAELSRKYVTLDAKGHEWGEWEVIRQATREEEGLMRRVCANDPSHVQEEIIPRYEEDEEGNPSVGIMEWFHRVVEYVRGFIDWFLRLFRP